MSDPITVTWSNTYYESIEDPEVWGPSFWFVVHLGTIQYPTNPSPFWKGRMKQFITSFPIMVPCESCRDHAIAFIERNWNNIDAIVSSRNNVFEFFVKMHNMVNKKLNKPEMTISDAYKKYSPSSVLVHKMKYD